MLLVVGAMGSLESSLHAQGCSFRLSGHVFDGSTDQPLEAVTVQWSPTDQIVLTDEQGYFELTGCCRSNGTLALSFVGYALERCEIEVTKDTSLRLTLTRTAVEIQTITVEQLIYAERVAADRALDESEIVVRTGQPLAAMLEQLAGVSQIQHGAHIAKPVVHGLYGNRLTLINNGIGQSGQQWGNDHGPAIDPLGADHIQILEGAASVAYPSANLGRLVLVEPAAIGDAKDWLAKGTYTLNTNGWGHGLHVAAQHARNGWGWRLGGTFQKAGDQRAPNYWLRNTGQQVVSASFQLERQWSPKWQSTLYASTYNAELGILRGAHVGNVTDLTAAFDRAEPFFTEPNFSYGMEAPRQLVHHHLIKLETNQQLSDQQQLTYTLAAQLNDRQEFDVRRGGRSTRPAMSLLQFTYDVGVRYDQRWTKGTELQLGTQTTLIDNTNNPETGILPFIPDHLTLRTGLFGILYQQWGRSRWELGLRYDYWNQSVATISRDLPRRIVRYQNNWHAGQATLGWTQRLNQAWRLWGMASYSVRPPAINEMYSQGLHQGVSSIEEGDPDLKPEQVGQGQFGVEVKWGEWCTLEALGYGQWYNGYIYLQPQPRPKLTIRGAFPVFRHEQTDARLLGTDVTFRLEDRRNWIYKATYSYLRGDDLIQDLPLVFLPPNRLTQELAYQAAPNWTWGKLDVSRITLRLTHQYTWRQYHLEPEQDFLAPPEGYHLFGAAVEGEGQLGRWQWRWWCRADNLLNTTYRDYLNRQRYFADALGTQVTIGLHVLLQPLGEDLLIRS